MGYYLISFTNVFKTTIRVLHRWSTLSSTRVLVTSPLITDFTERFCLWYLGYKSH